MNRMPAETNVSSPFLTKPCRFFYSIHTPYQTSFFSSELFPHDFPAALHTSHLSINTACFAPRNVLLHCLLEGPVTKIDLYLLQTTHSRTEGPLPSCSAQHAKVVLEFHKFLYIQPPLNTLKSPEVNNLSSKNTLQIFPKLTSQITPFHYKLPLTSFLFFNPAVSKERNKRQVKKGMTSYISLTTSERTVRMQSRTFSKCKTWYLHSPSG